MASPTKITYTFSFTDFQTHNADTPLPGDEVDIALREVKRASDQTIDRLNMIQRDDGQLANKSVGAEQMKDDVYGVFQGYVGQAKTHADNAAVSAGNAHNSELNSKASETNAKTSETNTKTSETNAKGSETNAAQSAAAALASENKAKTSETNAKTSETNAKTSETNSKTSETNSKVSETNAKASEDAAAQSAAHVDIAVSHLAGGLTGQAMLKRSNTDFDYGWFTIPGGGDMLVAIYDTNRDGKVDAADRADRATLADSVFWEDVKLKPAFGTAALANTADFATAAQGTKADNALAAPDLLAAPLKAVPVDNDTLVALDSEDSGKIKRFTWLAIKSRLKAYFDPIYQAALGFTPLNKAGDALAGNLSFGIGHLETTGDIYAARTAAPNTGVLYLGSSGTKYLFFDGTRYQLPGAPLSVDKLDAGGRITTTADIVAAGSLYAANGNAALNTDGNISGSRWGSWTGAASAWAFDAIDARIERRAEDWARAVGANYISRDRVTSGGFVGGDVNQPYFMFDGWSIETLISNRNLPYRISALGAGGIGTYALASSINTRSPGDQENGANLRYSTGGGGTPNSSVGGGSWRCMSYSTTTFPGLWLRYA